MILQAFMFFASHKIFNINQSVGAEFVGLKKRKRTKTDTRSNIPLLPISTAILVKYQNHPQAINQERLLSILSNQKMKSHLKEIVDLCGNHKELTFHIAVFVVLCFILHPDKIRFNTIN